MAHDRLSDEQPGRLSAVLNYAMSILFQAVLFFGAAAAIALFYLSYRPGPFVQALITTGFLMILPWFVISLLPTVFGLRDQDLKFEIFGAQLLCFALIIALLIVLAVSTGFHPALLDQAAVWLHRTARYLQEFWLDVRTFSEQTFKEAQTFFNETILPLFSR
jgi:hypothetical protein